MNRAQVGVAGVAIVAMGMAVLAQKPDFSGRWTADFEAMGLPADKPKRTVTIKQTADRLVLEGPVDAAGKPIPHPHDPSKVLGTTTFNLDGTESTNEVPTGVWKHVGNWDGNKIRIVGKRTGKDGSVREVAETWSLTGDTIIIERTDSDPTASVPKTVYRRIK